MASKQPTPTKTRKAPKQAKVLSLTQALSQLLNNRLLPDLQARAEQPSIAAALSHQHETETQAGRTGDTLNEFVSRTLEQVGAAWILSCVFVRTLEDRKLLARNRIAGEGATDSEQLFFELAPSLTARDYLLTVFQEVSSLPGGHDVLAATHNPAVRLSPSNDGARALLDFFRELDGTGSLRWQFTGQDTRFLGDLYQDLSEDVRKRYALLQTPEFVEAFILDYTLMPAIAEFGVKTARLIDPACGSGHFLLGAFERLLDAHLRSAPGVDVRTHALAALEQVYGVDINPYAVAIARFRLTLTYLTRCGFTQLKQAPKLKLNLVVADSLLHGAKETSLLFVEHALGRGDEAAWGFRLFALDDPEEAAVVFNQRYHAVVANPPYIMCKDAKLRELYRGAYESAAGKFALAAPFAERTFQLAVNGGFVGMINANSFMKREFGKALVEKVLPNIDITHVIDTADANIPGHTTPTVLLFGRNRKPASEQVSAVLGKRGEATIPADPEQGLVWRSIADHLSEIGFDNDYITVAEIPRETLKHHPWSLGGGGAAELKALLEERAEKTLGQVAEEIGFASFTGLDDAFILPASSAASLRLEAEVLRPMVLGEDVRDWAVAPSEVAICPYDKDTHEPLPFATNAKWGKFLWRYRTALKNVSSFGGKSRAEEGQNWWQWYRWQLERYACPYRITFAFVATHNHFVLDRGGTVFSRSAPIVKLPTSATEDDHLLLLAYLNSSTACFWMKQVMFKKNSQNYVGEVKDRPERIHYEFAGTQLGELPIPALPEKLSQYAREACRLASARQEQHPSNILRRLAQAPNVELAAALDRARTLHEEHQEALRRVQESIDQTVYSAFGLTDEASVGDQDYESRGPLGQNVSQIEQPLYKRPWLGVQGVFHRDEISYDELTAMAVRRALVDKLERCVANANSPVTARAIISQVSSDQTIETLLSARASKTESGDLIELLQADAVPFVRPHLYSEAGLGKHGKWMRTWQLQKRQDEGESVDIIPVPPKYDVKDFRDPNYFRLRGKLDVPKERFISYPDCQKDGDDSLLIGWAGWSYLQRAQALIALYQERKLEDGWPKERLMPMLLGLHELIFWLELWHSAPEADSENPAREMRQYLDAELNAHRLSALELEAWRPEAKRKRTPKQKAAT